MLPKQIKLALRKEKTFFSTAKKKFGTYFVVFYIKKPQITTKIAIIAPKKNFVKAVERNYIKRKVSAVFALCFHKINGYEIVIIPKYVAKNAKIEVLARELQRLLV